MLTRNEPFSRIHCILEDFKQFHFDTDKIGVKVSGFNVKLHVPAIIYLERPPLYLHIRKG